MGYYLKKILATLIITIIIIQIPIISVWAFTDMCPQTPPRMVRVEGKDGQMEPPIGYNDFEGYYVDLKFDVTFPVNPDQPIVGRYLNFYSHPINKPYKPNHSIVVTEKDVYVPPAGMTHRRMKGFSSGTIYYIDVAAYHTHRTENDEVIKSAESVRQQIKLKVLTDIEIEAYTHSTNEIKIVWDDVWDSNGRIDYRVYVSETSDFANTPPIYIGQNEIGPGKPVSVNESTGKLEYIHKVRDPGRVFYVKIEPDIRGSEVKYSPSTKVVEASSYILVKTAKISSTESGTVWRLDWSPVVTGLGDSSVKVSYQIYRGIVGTNDTPQYIATTGGTTFFINQTPEEQGYYYIIRASVTRNGVELYPNVRIMSDIILVKEEEIPAKPSAPELVDEFYRAPNDYIIRARDHLTTTSALILWRAPRKSDGTIDSDVTYDIWLVPDPSFIDNPPQNAQIASNIKMSQYNFVTNGTDIIGYKYGLIDLSPNTAYYVKIVAQKNFIDYVDGRLQEITLVSEPAVEIVVTPPIESAEAPLIPARPPFRVKKDLSGSYMIDTHSAILQIKNRWYEKYNFSSERWEFVETTRETNNDVPPYNPVANPPDNINYRVVEYDEDIKLDVGCVKFEDGMTQDDIRTIVASTQPSKRTGIPVEANDPWEDPKLNAPVETNPNVYQKHNMDIEINDLEPNTSYIVWVRARRGQDLLSGPSEPLIITTDPIIIVPSEKPIVPVFTFAVAGDRYIDISWDYRPGYTYNIKYGTVDNVNAAGHTMALEYQDIRDKSFYRVEGLQPNTIYYFWIQAGTVGMSGEKIYSDWSDSLVIKTLDYLPPTTPLGFGTKNSSDAITKNSITFEWLSQDSLNYLLEIADNIEYKDSTSIFLQSVSECTVEDLRSNTRYYARLFAYDPVSGLYSEPTASISVRTRYSYDDYDSDQDTDKVITGDFIIKAPYPVNGVWIVEITGVNADRMIEAIRKDNKIDFLIDLINMPQGTDRIEFIISKKVLKALDTLKENIIVKTAFGTFTIKPGTFQIALDRFIAERYPDYNYVISIGHDNSAGYKDIIPISKGIEFDFKIKTDAWTVSVDKLAMPVEFAMELSDASATDGIEVFIYKKDTDWWTKIPSVVTLDLFYEKSYLNVKITEPGVLLQAKEPAKEQFVDIRYHVYESSINNVVSLYDLKSITSMYFRPDANISIGEAIKLSMDVLKYAYDENYLNAAIRSGLLGSLHSAEDLCTRQVAISMAVRIYELKKGLIAKTSLSNINIFKDMEKVSPELYDKVKFAIENGVLFPIRGDALKPDAFLTRAEFVVLIEKVLALCGEIQ